MDALFADVISRLEAMRADYFVCLDGLSSEELDWSPGPEMNSLCVLAVHVTAAERFWIGIAIDDVIERDRPAEFRARGHSLGELQARFSANINFYRNAFASQSVGRLSEEVSFEFLDRRINCRRGWALLHALDHSAEHLGHAGMTRQLLDRR
ncbi:MAG: DUF664 domain-containing protein [Chloroflexota bacterium]|nr:DUF664 domain-containing protein [Chloroflexota bacterium]